MLFMLYYLNRSVLSNIWGPHSSVCIMRTQTHLKLLVRCEFCDGGWQHGFEDEEKLREVANHLAASALHTMPMLTGELKVGHADINTCIITYTNAPETP